MKNWNKNQKIDAIFIDIDGTLTINKDTFQLHDEIIDILKKAQEKNIYIVIATGRDMHTVPLLHKQYYHNDFGRFVITTVGAATMDFKNNEILNSVTMDVEDIEKMIEFAKKNNYMFYTDWKPFFYVNTSFLKRIKNNFRIKNPHSNYKMRDYKKAKAHEGMRKFSIRTNTEKEQTKKIIEQLSLELPNVEFTLSGNSLIEMTKKNINKAYAAIELCKILNIDLKNTVAIGDSMNDYEIFKVVGHPIAMGNAMSELKEISKYITDTVDDLGVKTSIQKIIENKAT